MEFGSIVCAAEGAKAKGFLLATESYEMEGASLLMCGPSVPSLQLLLIKRGQHPCVLGKATSSLCKC